MSKFASVQLHNLYKVSPMREGILNWYPFEADASVLEQTQGALTPLLKSKCKAVETFAGVYRGPQKFDYVVAIDVGEITTERLKQYRSYLNPHGRLLLVFENPYGLQYFAGKRNQRTNLPFQFWHGESKAEVSNRLEQGGFQGQKWYYPFSGHYFTREVYSENYLPNAFFNHRGFEYIEDDFTKEFDERKLWKEVARGGAFAFLCNSYLVEARAEKDDKPCIVDFAAITAYREKDKAFVTTVCSDGTANKKALYPQGKSRLRQMAENHNTLNQLGVSVLPVQLKDNTLTMKRMELPTLWDYWTEKLIAGQLEENELFSHYDRLRQAITLSAKNGRCYWELVPANCFYDFVKDEMIFFDQEYYWEDLDPDMVLVRAIYALRYSAVFQQEPRTQQWIEVLKQRYNLNEKWDFLVELADTKTREFVFYDAYTEPLDRTARRAAMRADERKGQRKQERAAEQASYNKMCVAVIMMQAMGIKRPAIYGYGARGKMLRYVLESVDMDVICIVDKGLPVVCGVPLFGSVNDIPTDIDGMIVTPVKEANEIAAQLRSKLTCPVITLEELINE